MHNDLVEVRVLFTKLFETQLLKGIEYFFLDSAASSQIFVFFLAHELCDGVLKTRLVLLDSNLLQLPHNDILETVFKRLQLYLVFAAVFLLLLQIGRHDHDVVERDRRLGLQSQHSLCLELDEALSQVIVPRQQFLHKFVGELF